ncbi:MAG: hypothetical protein IJ594_06250, partial [Oscillospiraceae bacterium]|nr:hypothetical protein [Oscillospiraceae bacterium]
AAGASYRRVAALLDDCYEDYYHFLTMDNLACIRSSQDLRDAYYAGEYAWCDEQMAEVSQTMEDLLCACGASPLAQKLERRYFWEGFTEDYGPEGESVYDEELVALLREESALLTRYRALMAQLPEGEAALLRFYREQNEAFAQIYIALVRVRQAMAEKLGYESYEQFSYEYDYGRDYTPEQAAAYAEEIRTWIVPLCAELDAADAYEDYAYLPADKLHRALGAAARRMGGSVEEAFDFMDAYDLYDIGVSPDKADNSFEIYLPDYEAPFLFLDAYGDIGDLTNYAHEFGHYVDAYVNYDADETVDVSETFSQAMEYLVLGYLDDTLDDSEREALTRIKMRDTLDLYVQQTSFAEFEHAVYAMDADELSAQALNDLFLRLTKAYGYFEPGSEDYYALSWVDISHFFEAPFYVIAYPVSNDLAMQIYELERGESGAGLEKYLEILPREYSGLLDTAQAGGLESPFAPGRIEKVARDLRESLAGAYAAAA